jgi:hypothetical protein
VCLCASLFVADRAAATILITVHDGQSVALATDSAATLQGAYSTGMQACKMFQIDDKFVGIAGLVRIRDSGFDPVRTVAHRLRTSHDIMQAMTLAGGDIRSSLAGESDHIQRLDPWHKLPMIVQVGLITLVKPFPVAVMITITPTSVELKSDKYEGAITWRAGGETKALEKVPRPPRASAGEVAKWLAQFAVNSNTPHVGGPVDVVELRNGQPARWLRKKDGCPVVY